MGNQQATILAVIASVILLSIGAAWVIGIGEDTSEREGKEKEKRYTNMYQVGSAPDWRIYDTPPEKRPEAMESETYEVTRFPNSSPTPEDLESAWRHYKESYEAARERGWFDFEKAKEDGYKQFDQIHYVNREYYLNDENLNPYKPESLIYYDNPRNEDEKVLAGFMYVADGLDVEGKQFAGPLTVWHYHPRGPENCFAEVLAGGKDLNTTDCSEGDITRPRTPEMIHVWFVRTPEGPFSSSMRVTSDQLNKTEMMDEEEFKSYAEKKYEKYFQER